MRVVAGSLRGRRLLVPDGPDLRPTADRTREAIFNVLEGGRFSTDGGSVIVGARVLDAFCGTGALGIEAMSRGAESLTLLDNSAEHLSWAHRNLENLGLTARTLRADATRPGPAPVRHDLVLIDPPYASGQWPVALASLWAHGWLAPEALIVVEQGARGPTPGPPDDFTVLDTRRYGAARVLFLRAPQGPPTSDRTAATRKGAMR